MRAKLLESDSNENGESRDDFEEYRPSTPTPSAQNGTAPSVTLPSTICMVNRVKAREWQEVEL